MCIRDSLELLQVLCGDEIARRDAAGLERRLTAARFEQASTIEEFDFLSLIHI